MLVCFFMRPGAFVRYLRYGIASAVEGWENQHKFLCHFSLLFTCCFSFSLTAPLFVNLMECVCMKKIPKSGLLFFLWLCLLPPGALFVLACLLVPQMSRATLRYCTSVGCWFGSFCFIFFFTTMILRWVSFLFVFGFRTGKFVQSFVLFSFTSGLFLFFLWESCG